MTTSHFLMDPYEAVIADLRKKRDEIDSAISLIETLRAHAGTSSVLSDAVKGAKATDEVGSSEALEEGTFHGMSIVDATKMLLTMRKRKMGNPEIARELIAGGLVMNSAEPVNTVGSVLTRRFHQVGDVVRVARGTWGLKEWYPGRTFKAKPGTDKQENEVAGGEKLVRLPGESDASWRASQGAGEDDELFS